MVDNYNELPGKSNVSKTIKLCIEDIKELSDEKSEEDIYCKTDNEKCVFVTEELKCDYGFIEEKFDEQKILDFVNGKIKTMRCSKVNQFDENYEAN